MGGYCRRWDNNITILLWMLSNHIDLSLLGSLHLSLPHSLFHPFIFCSGSHTLNPISLTNHLSICLSNLNEAIPKWPQEHHPPLSLSLTHTHTHTHPHTHTWFLYTNATKSAFKQTRIF